MSRTVTLLRLLNAQPDVQCAVLAGFEGMEKEIVTITSIESPKSVEKLRSGTLVMTAGVVFTEETLDQLYHYVELLIKQGCVALGIKTRFIRKVPESALLLANINKFPIFSLPDDLMWSEFFSAFYELKYRENSNIRILKSDPRFVEEIRRQTQNSLRPLDDIYVKMIQVPAVIINDQCQVLARNCMPGILDEVLTYSMTNSKPIGTYFSHSGDAAETFVSIQYKNSRLTSVFLSSDTYLLMEHTGKNLSYDEIELLQMHYKSLYQSGRGRLSDEEAAKQILNGLVAGVPVLNLSELLPPKQNGKTFYAICLAYGHEKALAQVFSDLKEALEDHHLFHDIFFFSQNISGRKIYFCKVSSETENCKIWQNFIGAFLHQQFLEEQA